MERCLLLVTLISQLGAIFSKTSVIFWQHLFATQGSFQDCPSPCANPDGIMGWCLGPLDNTLGNGSALTELSIGREELCAAWVIRRAGVNRLLDELKITSPVQDVYVKERERGTRTSVLVKPTRSTKLRLISVMTPIEKVTLTRSSLYINIHLIDDNHHRCAFHGMSHVTPIVDKISTLSHDIREIIGQLVLDFRWKKPARTRHSASIVGGALACLPLGSASRASSRIPKPWQISADTLPSLSTTHSCGFDLSTCCSPSRHWRRERSLKRRT